jgi:O-succinylbenzoate synthase
MKQIDSWDEQWSEPSTPLERAAPFVAFGLALLLAWL